MMMIMMMMLTSSRILWDSLCGSWRRQYISLILFRQRHGHALVPWEWKEDKALARWVNEQQRYFKSGILPPTRRSLLQREGMAFSRIIGWWERHSQLLEHRARFGHCDVPLRWRGNKALGCVGSFLCPHLFPPLFESPMPRRRITGICPCPPLSAGLRALIVLCAPTALIPMQTFLIFTASPRSGWPGRGC